MPTDVSRRAFVRASLAAMAATWASACGTPMAATPSLVPTASRTLLPLVEAPSAAPTVLPTAVPAPTMLPAAPVALQFSGHNALQHAAAQMQWVPRDVGTPGWQACGDYIVAQLKQFGWQVEEQRFPYQGVNCRNIIGKRGSGPQVILGAHYDARRRADQDPDATKRTQPVPAANDGASGVAVLLELARVLQPETLGKEVWLAAFDAEDNGDLDGWQWTVGSDYMAKSLASAPAAVVVLDMIGDADQQIYYEQNSTSALREAIWGVAAELGYASFVPQTRYSMLDDHTPFLQRGFPAVDLIDFDYPYWHTTGDTLDKISAASLEAVGRTMEQWLQRP